MKIQFHKRYVKNFDKRIKINNDLLAQFNSRYALFIQDSSNPTLKDHQLTGVMKGKRAFSITGDVRVIYQIINDSIEFLDIGSHNQVYK